MTVTNETAAHRKDDDNDVNLVGLDLIWARYYSSIVLPFRLRPGLSQEDTVKQLQQSLNTTCEKAPIFTGRVFEKPVTPEEPAEGQRELRENPDWIPQVVHNDLTHTSLEYDELEEAAFPPEYFDAKTLMPTDSAASAWIAPSTGAPVIVVQANFIKGGLLLAVRAHHAVADGTGATLFMKHWAWHTRQSLNSQTMDGSDVFMKEASHNRTILHRYWKEQGKPIAESSDTAQWRLLGLLPPPAPSELPPVQPELEGRIFYVSAASLKALTNEGQQKTASGDSPQVNINDVLSAFLWRSTIRARRKSCSPSSSAEYADSESTTLDTVVNGRAFVGSKVPYDYIANMVLFASPSMTIGELLSPSTTLSDLSQMTHKAATSISMEQALAAYGLATTMSDFRYVPYSFGKMEGTEVFVNSWMALQVNEVSFGDMFLNGGCPDSSRPLAFEYGGYCRRMVIMPMNSQGACEIFVEMRGAEIEALQQDEDFAKFAQLLC